MIAAMVLLYWLLAAGDPTGTPRGTLVIDERTDTFEIMVGGQRAAWGNTDGLEPTLNRLHLMMGRKVRQQ